MNEYLHDIGTMSTLCASCRRPDGMVPSDGVRSMQTHGAVPWSYSSGIEASRNQVQPPRPTGMTAETWNRCGDWIS